MPSDLDLLSDEFIGAWQKAYLCWRRHSQGESYASIAKDVGMTRQKVGVYVRSWEDAAANPNYADFVKKIEALNAS